MLLFLHTCSPQIPFLLPVCRYGTPDWVQPYAEYRGGGISAFGILEWGACGLTNGDGTVLWPKEHVTSIADQNPDYPGSCGRCYEFKCHEGLVLGSGDKPTNYSESYFAFWEYLNKTDPHGRAFPGVLFRTDSQDKATLWDSAV